MSLGDVQEVDFPGTGPFAIPLLAEFVTMITLDDKDWALAEFRFEDGPSIHVPIASHTADLFADAIAVWKLKREQKNAEGSTKH